MTPLLTRQSRIAAIAPSGAYDPARLDAGLAIVRDAGLNVVPFEGMLQPERYLAAPDAVRLRHLVDALLSPDFDAVWIVRGGYGLTRLLAPLLSALPAELPPKPILGFSDVTALFSALDGRGATLLHAPVLHSLAATDEASRTELFRVLGGQSPAALVGESWVPGTAEGTLVGGNLAMFAALCGTPYQAKTRGRILVLEDVGEALYRLDRMLQQLASSGFFDGVAAIAFGEFAQCVPPKDATWTLRDVLLDHVASLGVPVLGGLPIGHGAANRPFAWGACARIDHGTLTWTLPSSRVSA